MTLMGKPQLAGVETKQVFDATESPFKSFWMGGFECSDQLNIHGERVDLLSVTNHLSLLAHDYKLLTGMGIKTVREGICWSKVEPVPYQYDFSTVKYMLQQGAEGGTQQLWDICHFGFPTDLSPLHPQFTKRFASVCAAFVRFHRQQFPNQPLIVTPINEVSFLSWLGGEAAGTTPYCKGYGWNIKYALMRAYIAGIYAMKDVDPDIRIMTTEPLVNIVPPLFADEEQIATSKEMHNDQYQALDILCGAICPELGGTPELLDILGFNYYYNNQWVSGFDEFLPWVNTSGDERWRPLSDLLTEAYQRYQRPMVLSETSHSGEHRPQWLTFIADECAKLTNAGLPFWGVCLYPIIDRPDWDDLQNWHHSGLWDHQNTDESFNDRVLNNEYARALQQAQILLH